MFIYVIHFSRHKKTRQGYGGTMSDGRAAQDVLMVSYGTFGFIF